MNGKSSVRQVPNAEDHSTVAESHSVSFASLCTLGLSSSEQLREKHPLLVFKSNRAYLLLDGVVGMREGREGKSLSQSDRHPREDEDQTRIREIFEETYVSCMEIPSERSSTERKKNPSRNRETGRG